MKKFFSLVLLATALLFSFGVDQAAAHKPSDSYLRVSTAGEHINGSFQIAIRDLDVAVDIDGNRDRQVTWGEVTAAEARVRSLFGSQISFATETAACRMSSGPFSVTRKSDGAYLSVPFFAECDSIGATLHYSLLFDVDAMHRAIIVSDGATLPTVLSPKNQTMSLVGETTGTGTFHGIVVSGIHHILEGTDHILFLVTLLLPMAVSSRKVNAWKHVFKVVTAFTVAHSFTLALMVTGIVSPPSQAIEIAIACTVLLAAANLVFPIVREGHWKIAFLFGLVHGFGFANVFRDAGLRGSSLGTTLLGFNLGVELGQLALVCCLLPILLLAARTRNLGRVVVPTGGIAISVLSIVWIAERSFQMTILGL